MEGYICIYFTQKYILSLICFARMDFSEHSKNKFVYCMGVTIISNVHAIPLFYRTSCDPFSANQRFQIIYKNDNEYYTHVIT
jgi:hypothetical protein